MEKEKILERIKSLPNRTKWLALALVGVLVLGLVIGIASIPNGERQLTTISEASLKEILKINELSTVEYTYNAVATKRNDKDKVMYYVAYEGVIEAGIDFEQVTISIDDDKKIVTVTVPAAQVFDTKVKLESMDFIFTKSKYETETVSQEAYKLCKNDLKNRANEFDLILETAQENAVSSVRALFEPWIKTIDQEFKVEVK